MATIDDSSQDTATGVATWSPGQAQVEIASQTQTQIQTQTQTTAAGQRGGQSLGNWTTLQQFFFRSSFLFLILLIIPLDWRYYQRVLLTSPFHLHFQDLFQVTHYVPVLLSVSDWGVASFAGWGLALLVGMIGALVWGSLDKDKGRRYDQLYYWLRVLVRYRLAIGLIGYGVIKLFPLQLPYPGGSCCLDPDYQERKAGKL